MSQILPPAIDVWQIPWREHLNHLAACQSLLDESERAKAAAFHFDVDRHRYIISHGALRLILAHALDLPPQVVPIVQKGWQKPRLDGAYPIEFNLTHSGDHALVAVSRGPAVGIDVEQVKTDFDLRALAARFFSRYESASLFQLPPDAQVEAFFRIWTRKEAFLKARGDGLSLPLAEFDVSLEPHCDSALLATRFEPNEVTRWQVKDLPAPPGYAAALAVEGKYGSITARPWTFWP